jgi:hypothetical protein
LDGAAVVSLAKLEERPLTPEFRDRVAWTRRLETADMADRQKDWRSWRWRDARRLSQVEALTGAELRSPPRREERTCQGVPKPSAQLTPPSNPGT